MVKYASKGERIMGVGCLLQLPGMEQGSRLAPVLNSLVHDECDKTCVLLCDVAMILPYIVTLSPPDLLSERTGIKMSCHCTQQ